MKRILKIVCRLIIGFIFCSSGTVLAVNSNLGLSPWDVFHQGLSKMTGLSMGQVSIFVGLIVVIPTSNNFLLSLLMLMGSLVTMAIGSYLYIGCAMGCGPRDGLMVALVKLTGKSVVLIRSCIEISVLVIGWLLGGTVGLGTLITVFGVGSCVQLIFKIFKFDVGKVNHKNIKDGFLFFNKYVNS